MKERLIKWTRNEKNELKLVIVTVVLEFITVLIMAFKCNWRITELTFIERTVFVIIVWSIIFGFIIIEDLFNQKEDTLRDNKFKLIIFSNNDLWLLILVIIMFYIIGIIITIGYKILATILVIFMIFAISEISYAISEFFKKKLK